MPKVSQEHLDARRRQIMQAADNCFARDGIHKTSIPDIVRESGLSTGAIYKYFKSKAEIVSAIVTERHEREMKILDLAGKERGIESLRRLAREFFALLGEKDEKRRRRAGVQFWAESLRDPEILTLAKAGIDEPRRKLIKVIRAAQSAGELPRGVDPEGLARVMIALFQGFILQQAWDEKADAAGFARSAEMLLDGLRCLAG